MTAKHIPAATKKPPPEDEEDDLSIEYPDSDGEPMADNDFQFTAMVETASTLRLWFAHLPDVYVGGDMLMYYRMNDNETRVAPDVFAVFGADGKHPRYSWLVWREGKAPDFVIEMASRSTWRRDLTEKRDIYAEMGVTEYWRFDPTGDHFTPPLSGERLTEDGEYHPVALETDGDGILRSHSAVLGLDVCVLPGLRLRLYDPASGRWLLTHHEEAAGRQAAEAGQQAAEEENRLLREQLRLLQSGQ